MEININELKGFKMTAQLTGSSRLTSKNLTELLNKKKLHKLGHQRNERKPHPKGETNVR